jgi:23S rRNA maturation-related 3'-5' exoribonuclease YhaM
MDLNDELNRIKDEEIRNFTKECLDKAPPHFWYRPASSTGKYHAPDENELGGLILHTKRVCKVGEILIECWITPIEADVVRSACILHDICKYGDGSSPTRYTLNNHPKLGGEFVKRISGDKYTKEKVDAISNAIISHMGKWGTPFENKSENLIVHFADVVATEIYEEVKM